MSDEDGTVNNIDNMDNTDLQVTRSLSIDNIFHFPDPHSPTYMILPTNFNINTPQNQKVPYTQGIGETVTRIAYTNEQQSFASKVTVPKDRDDFADQV
jgi:hypothetical protein